MRPRVQPLGFNTTIIENELVLTEKEQFVLKYLDALETKKLQNHPDLPDWDYNTHDNIDNTKMKILVKKYCPQGTYV